MRRFVAALVAVVALPAFVGAHYPWFIPKKDGVYDFVFEEGMVYGDGFYLDPFIKDGKFWVREAGKKDTPMKFAEMKEAAKVNDKDKKNKDKGKRWLRFKPAGSAPRSLECYCQWGVYKGMLLHYYARHIDAGPDQLAELGPSPDLKYNLVPRIVGKGKVRVDVLWQGKPVADRTVLVSGVGKLTSDKQGQIEFDAKGPRTYMLRSAFVEAEPTGMIDGKAYKGLRQTATVSFTMPRN